MASSINAITTGSGGVITTADNSGILNLQSGGTTVAAVTSSGVAVTGTLSASTTGQVGTTLGVGAATPSASGAGITFPATQSASTDANTLDDYEEGTWTPTWNVSSGSWAMTNLAATYVKIGKKVTCALSFDTLSLPVGKVNQLEGLPFASANNGQYYVASVLGYRIGAASYNLVCRKSPNSTVAPVQLNPQSTSGWIDLDVSYINASSGLDITLTYFTA